MIRVVWKFLDLPHLQIAEDCKEVPMVGDTVEVEVPISQGDPECIFGLVMHRHWMRPGDPEMGVIVTLSTAKQSEVEG